jgi:hypothetical protein
MADDFRFSRNFSQGRDEKSAPAHSV